MEGMKSLKNDLRITRKENFRASNQGKNCIALPEALGLSILVSWFSLSRAPTMKASSILSTLVLCIKFTAYAPQVKLICLKRRHPKDSLEIAD